MRPIEPLRLIVFDIDGVLTDGEAQPWDLGLMAELAALNRAARRDSSRPAATLCSGRPAPYVDAMLQAIDGHLPGLFESGAGLYAPQGYRFLAHPSLDGAAALAEVRQCLAGALVHTGHAYLQPGKEYSLSLFPSDPAHLATLRPLAAAALGPLAAAVELVYSASCLNVMPAGIDKGVGLRFLAQATGIPTTAMLAVGDSEVDLSMLQAAGYSAAPANASPAVQQIVQFVAPSPAGQGVREILAHYRITY